MTEVVKPESDSRRYASLYKPARKQGGLRIFTDEQIREIRRLRAKGKSLYELGHKYGCNHTTISSITLRKTYKDVE